MSEENGIGVDRPDGGLETASREVCDVPVVCVGRVGGDGAGLPADDVLRRFRRRHPGVEAVFVSTCHRRELVVSGMDDADARASWEAIDDGTPYVQRGSDAVGHVLLVATGAASPTLGDREIRGQLERARALAREIGCVGPVLERLFDLAASTGRRARRETEISAGGAGVGSLVRTAIERRAPAAGSVCVVGAGDAAAVALRELCRRPDTVVSVTNRTLATARRLAAGHDDVTVVPFSETPETDVVVLAADVDDRDAARLGTSATLVVDLRADGERVAANAVGLREMQPWRDAHWARRHAARREVERIVAEATVDFERWVFHRGLGAVIGALYEAAEAELERRQIVGVPDCRRLVRRLLHEEVEMLKAGDLGVTRRVLSALDPEFFVDLAVASIVGGPTGS